MVASFRWALSCWRRCSRFHGDHQIILWYAKSMTTKFTISLPDEDAHLLDEYVRDHGLRGRSAGIRAALRLLSTSGLERDYAAAFAEGDVDEVWDAVTADTE